MFTEEVMMIGEIEFIDVSKIIKEYDYHFLALLLSAINEEIEIAIKFDIFDAPNNNYYITDEYIFYKKTDDFAIKRLIDYVVLEPQSIKTIIRAIEYQEGVFFLNQNQINTVNLGRLFVYEKGIRRSIWGNFELESSKPFRLYVSKKDYESIKANKEDAIFCDQLEKEGHTLASLYRQLNNNETQKRQVDYKQLREWQERAAIEDGKPTAEQLQQQLDAAKARIAELEAMQAQPVPHNQPNELQQPYPCLQPIADIIEAFEHNPDFVKYGQGIQQQMIADWLFSKHKLTRDKVRHIKELITAHYNIKT
jgi:hypothetical protein